MDLAQLLDVLRCWVMRTGGLGMQCCAVIRTPPGTGRSADERE
jgi:hypothetical protein